MRSLCKSFALVMTGVSMIVLFGCKADVDLDHLDTNMSVKANVSLPLGSVTIKMGDFLNPDSVPGLSMLDDSTYQYCASAQYTNSFHPIDISSFIGKGTKECDIYSKLKSYYPVISGPITIPQGVDVTLEFPMPLEFDGLNTNPTKERLDSLIITQAQFTSILNPVNMDFQWNELKSVTLVLDNHFHTATQEIAIPLSGYGYNTPIPVNVKQFNLCMMRDASAPCGPDNVLTSVGFTLRMHLQTTQSHVVNSNAKIQYAIQVGLIDYKAVFGYFSPSNKMEESVVDEPIENVFPFFKEIQGIVLPLAEPSFVVKSEHTMAMPLDVYLKGISVVSKEGVKRAATFKDPKTGKVTTDKHHLFPSEVAVTDPIGKINRDTIMLNNTPEMGHIDSIFTISPAKISYAFEISPDTVQSYTAVKMKQYRMCSNSDLKIDLDLSIPFRLNKGTNLAYSDTIKDIHITEFSIDSLLKQATIIKDVPQTNLILALDVENWIPFEMEGTFTFLDSVNAPIKGLTQHITFAAAKEISASGKATKPSKNNIKISLSKEDLMALTSVRSIILDCKVGKNQSLVGLGAYTKLKVSIGLTADVEVNVDLSKQQ